METLASIAEAGVLALGPLPHRAPGLRDAKVRDRRVRAAAKRLAGRVIRAPDASRLEAILAETVPGAIVEPVEGSSLAVSIARRRSEAGDTLLLFNESWSARTTRLRFTRGGGPLMRWDPRTGLRERLRDCVEAGDVIALELAPVESLLLTLGPALKAPAGQP